METYIGRAASLTQTATACGYWVLSKRCRATIQYHCLSAACKDLRNAWNGLTDSHTWQCWNWTGCISQGHLAVNRCFMHLAEYWVWQSKQVRSGHQECVLANWRLLHSFPSGQSAGDALLLHASSRALTQHASTIQTWSLEVCLTERSDTDLPIDHHCRLHQQPWKRQFALLLAAPNRVVKCSRQAKAWQNDESDAHLPIDRSCRLPR